MNNTLKKYADENCLELVETTEGHDFDVHEYAIAVDAD